MKREPSNTNRTHCARADRSQRVVHLSRKAPACPLDKAPAGPRRGVGRASSTGCLRGVPAVAGLRAALLVSQGSCGAPGGSGPFDDPPRRDACSFQPYSPLRKVVADGLSCVWIAARRALFAVGRRGRLCLPTLKLLDPLVDYTIVEAMKKTHGFAHLC